MTKSVAPSVREHAFTCPHCGAYTTQYWFYVFGEYLKQEPRVPYVPDEEEKQRFLKDVEATNPKILDAMTAHIDQLLTGQIKLHNLESSKYIYVEVRNLFLSQCYVCQKIAVWVHDRMIYPPTRSGPAPNADLPEDVIADYEEARSIVDLSPRGAAALLRLCVQKLCVFLGEKGKNIDDDIASLVTKGLNPLVQQALDVVRVIGNESVHPGTMDLKDDRDTATMLFGLINSIADQMITHPKTVSAMYSKLPPAKLAAIAARDAKLPKK